MNTFEYIMERKRMCDSFNYGCGCQMCPACDDDLCCAVSVMSKLDPKEQIAIVERWSAEHPKKKKKTRQEVFLKQNPEARLDEHGVLRICPVEISAEYRDKGGECLFLYSDCRDCRKDFWMEEVKGDK